MDNNVTGVVSRSNCRWHGRRVRRRKYSLEEVLLSYYKTGNVMPAGRVNVR